MIRTNHYNHSKNHVNPLQTTIENLYDALESDWQRGLGAPGGREEVHVFILSGQAGPRMAGGGHWGVRQQ